jgi:hypothetical protein
MHRRLGKEYWVGYLRGLVAGLLVAFVLLTKYADVSVFTWVLLLAVPWVGLMLATSSSGSSPCGPSRTHSP